MDQRRVRRFGRRQRTDTLLPVRAETQSASLSYTISCWYCEYKFAALNGPLFRFGRRHAGCLRAWFSMGVGFSLATLLGATLILVWNLGCALRLFGGKAELADIFSSVLFGFAPGVYGLRLSIVDIFHLMISTSISVFVHEFGHTIAAASEGIQTEYVGIYIAVLFPGALVAFNQELLQTLQHFAALRIYCAGIWHNAVCCAVCGLALFLLPLILSPFYIHGQSLMVLDLPSISPLSGYLTPGDIIISLDGKHIHNEQEWFETTALIDGHMLQISNHSKHAEGFAVGHGRKGYCVPTALIEESRKIHLIDNGSPCPNGLTEFVARECYNSSKLVDAIVEDDHSKRIESQYCLNAKEVVKLNKCGDGWVTDLSIGSNCPCSKDESCLSPVQVPGIIWTEIAYSRPYSHECSESELGGNLFLDSKLVDFKEDNCGGTFVFVGDPVSMAHSLRLTSYQPRWAFSITAYFPKVMEKSLMCTFHISLTLALLNSLPVYFLDGQSILEAALCHFTLLGPRKRAKVLQACLLGGTLISVLALTRIFFINL